MRRCDEIRDQGGIPYIDWSDRGEIHCCPYHKNHKNRNFFQRIKPAVSVVLNKIIYCILLNIISIFSGKYYYALNLLSKFNKKICRLCGCVAEEDWIKIAVNQSFSYFRVDTFKCSCCGKKESVYIGQLRG